jgi:hypothetical protein
MAALLQHLRVLEERRKILKFLLTWEDLLNWEKWGVWCPQHIAVFESGFYIADRWMWGRTID